MEGLGQHDTVLAIKVEFPVFVTTKVENEEEEQQCSSYVETVESNLDVKSEEVDIKLEEIAYESIKSIQEEYLASEVEDDFNAVDDLKQEGTYIDENHFDLKKEVRYTKAEHTTLTSIPDAVLSSNPEGDHNLAPQNTLENITSAFETCLHDGRKRKSAKKKKSPNALLKCEQCSFECKRPSRFHLHMRVHKDPSELNMYECTHCGFKTKHKNSLKGHSILHKQASNIPRYKCNSCNFESKRKGSLARHIIRRHQKSSRFKKGLLTCKQCSYECRYPSELHSHIRIHKDPSELNMYECMHCGFITKYRQSLKVHLIIHKDTTEIPQYKCNSCDFKNKRKNALRRHIIGIHKGDPGCIDAPTVFKMPNLIPLATAHVNT